MRGEGRIIDGPDVHLAEWRPDEFLPVVGHDAARYSRGYLAADPAAWFPALADHWLPLSHVLTSSLTFRSCERVFELPETLECPVIFEVDSELAVIAFERDAGSIIAQTLLPGCGPSAAAVALDYIQRRLLSSLSRSWSGSEGLVARYLSSGDWSGVDVAAALNLNVEIDGSLCTIWFGFGQRLLEKLDGRWRRKLFDDRHAAAGGVLGDEVFYAGIEIAELGVPPAMLIDYVRSGAVVDLELPVSRKARVRVNGRAWVEGNICQFRDRYALEVTNTHPAAVSFPEGTTRMRVELAQTDIDHEGLIEHAQRGAVLLTETPLGSRVSLIVSGEHVASATLGVINGSFALRVLPK